MDTPMARPITPARIIALALIGLMVLGLAYLGHAPGEARVSVPAGATAGDLRLEPCTYATEGGNHAADCGTLVVPENRANPKTRLIALPVIRIRARSEQPGVPVFRLFGGPGLSNMKFPQASRINENHDVVLVGYRGIDGSTRLDCPEVTSVLKHSADFLAEESLRAYADAHRACADRLQDDGVDLAGYTLAQRVDDLEAARGALGYDRVDLLSQSVGSRIAMTYAWRHPNRIHRSVMVAVNPPGHFLWNPQTTDEQIDRYAALCAEDDSCRERTDDLAASMRRTASGMPERWLFLPIKESNVRLASFFGLMESTSTASPLSAPMTLDSWLSASQGDASGLWFLSFMSRFVIPESFVWGETAAMSRADARAAHDWFSSGGDQGSILGDPGTTFLWGGGRTLDAWPANPSEDEYGRVQTSRVETLVIGGTVDFATPPRSATDELLPYLPNGHQVVLAEIGHSKSFWAHQPDAGSRLINTFLDSGRVDDSLYQPASIDFTPAVTQTALGKGLAGTMVGFALVTVVSLGWMARRVHRQGHFGRKASAMLRSLYPVVLGLGGWFVGILVVITALPGVPLDDELLAALSVGLPIGLGLFSAWANGRWSAATKAIGFAAAVSGALVGAWLGFNATAGLLALITAIAGATAGGNLTILALDIAWDRQGRDRFVEAEAKQTVEARPATAS
jgi:pimeloyl-ACP methyl ester carboxylesterase